MINKNRLFKMPKAILLLVVVLLPIFQAGCSNTYLDPKQIGRFRPTPVMHVILDSLGVVEEPKSSYSEAEDPIPSDLIADQSDYVFSTGDIIRLYIYELRSPRTDFIQDFTVTESGYVSIPDVGLVRAAGMTENELEDAIKDLLAPDIIVNPSVTATLYQSEKMTFSINGDGARRPGRYVLPRKDDFRLTDAIAMAGSVAQFNVTYIYVTRQVTGKEASLVAPVYSEPSEPSFVPVYQEELSAPQRTYDNYDGGVEILPYTPDTPEYNNAPSEDDVIDLLTPYSRVKNSNTLITAAEMTSVEKLGAMSATDSGRIEWVFENGQYVPVVIDAEPAPTQYQPNTGSTPFEQVDSFDPLRQSDPTRQKQVDAGANDLDKYGWDQIGKGGVQTRVIRIPTEALLAGDPRYNVIIQPGDSISIPVDVIGEFEVMGNTNYQGAIDMTGRPVTLKQAIALAGGLGELAWPKKVEVVRRIGQNKEVTVMVDLDKIAKGEQPDFFIKPFDLINVGTHGMSWHLYILRTAFRAYYGFGFTYDRNWTSKQIREDVSDNSYGIIPW